MKSLRRSASTWKAMRGLWHERLSFTDWLSGFCGKCVSCFFSKQEVCGIIISTLKIVWKLDCFGSRIKCSLPSWSSQFLTIQRCLFSSSHALPISLNTLTLELSLFQCFANWVPKQSSVRPRGRHPRVWKVQRLLALLFILRIFQAHISARMPYVAGHSGALWPGAHV